MCNLNVRGVTNWWFDVASIAFDAIAFKVPNSIAKDGRGREVQEIVGWTGYIQVCSSIFAEVWRYSFTLNESVKFLLI